MVEVRNTHRQWNPRLRGEESFPRKCILLTSRRATQNANKEPRRETKAHSRFFLLRQSAKRDAYMSVVEIRQNSADFRSVFRSLDSPQL